LIKWIVRTAVWVTSMLGPFRKHILKRTLFCGTTTDRRHNTSLMIIKSGTHKRHVNAAEVQEQSKSC
jgi:hypothetical protein